jgi:hypothetical protein
MLGQRLLGDAAYPCLDVLARHHYDPPPNRWYAVPSLETGRDLPRWSCESIPLTRSTSKLQVNSLSLGLSSSSRTTMISRAQYSAQLRSLTASQGQLFR